MIESSSLFTPVRAEEREPEESSVIEKVSKVIEGMAFPFTFGYYSATYSCIRGERTYRPLYYTASLGNTLAISHLDEQQLPSLLEEAIAKKNWKVITYLAKNHPEHFANLDEYENTPLHKLCGLTFEGWYEVMGSIVNSHPSFFAIKDHEGITPLHSITKKCSSIAYFLAKNHPEYFKISDNSGNTPLHQLCTNQVMGKLIQFFAERHLDFFEVKNKEGKTPFHFACRFGMRRFVCSIAKFYPKFWEIADDKGETLLHEVCRYQHLEIAKSLIWKNPHLFGIPNKEGITPLHFVCENDWLEIAVFLKERHPEFFRLKDKEGYFPFIPKNVVYSENFTEGNYSIEYKIGRFIAETDPELLILKNAGGNTLLHTFCAHGYTRCVCLVLENHPEYFFIQNDLGETPLHSACEMGNRDIVYYLVEKKPELFSLTDNLGDTPLYKAWVRSGLMICKDRLELLELQDDQGETLFHKIFKDYRPPYIHLFGLRRIYSTRYFSIKDYAGNTPLHSACEWGCLDSLKFYAEHKPEVFSIEGPHHFTPLQTASYYHQISLIEWGKENRPELLHLDRLEEWHNLFVYSLMTQQKFALFLLKGGFPIPDAIDEASLPSGLYTQHIRYTSEECEKAKRLFQLMKVMGNYRVNPEHYGENNKLFLSIPLFPAPKNDLGILKTHAKKGLSNMLNHIQNRAPYTGTPPEGPALNRFYDRLEAALQHIAVYISDHPEERVPFLEDLEETGIMCGERWLFETLKLFRRCKFIGAVEKNEQYLLEILFCLHDKREDFFERVIAKKHGQGVNVHIYGEYERKLGSKLGLMGCDSFEADPYRLFLLSGRDVDAIEQKFIEEYNDFFVSCIVEEYLRKNRDTCVEIAKELYNDGVRVEGEYEDRPYLSLLSTETGILKPEALAIYLQRNGILS